MSKILMNEVWAARDQRDSAQAEVRRLKETNAKLIAALKAVLEWEPRQKDEDERIAYEQAHTVIKKTEGGCRE